MPESGLVVVPSVNSWSTKSGATPSPLSATVMCSVEPSCNSSTSTSLVGLPLIRAASIALSSKLPRTVVTSTGSTSRPGTQVFSPMRERHPGFAGGRGLGRQERLQVRVPDGVDTG